MTDDLERFSGYRAERSRPEDEIQGNLIGQSPARSSAFMGKAVEGGFGGGNLGGSVGRDVVAGRMVRIGGGGLGDPIFMGSSGVPKFLAEPSRSSADLPSPRGGSFPIGAPPEIFRPVPPVEQPAKEGVPLPKEETTDDVMGGPEPGSLPCDSVQLFRTRRQLRSTPQDISISGLLPPIVSLIYSTPDGKQALKRKAEAAVQTKAKQAIAKALARGQLPGTWAPPVAEALKNLIAKDYENLKNPCVRPCQPRIRVISYAVASDPIMPTEPDIQVEDRPVGVLEAAEYHGFVRSDGWLEWFCEYSFYYLVTFDVSYSLTCVDEVEERF